jgi:DNA-binding response OmpR family regulator
MSSAAASAPAGSPIPAGTNILIIDDLQDNIDVLSRRFQNRSLNVFEANDGPDALQLLSVTPVDVILCDVMMPGMSGLDVVRKVRSRRSAAALPIIMVSARTDQAMIVDCLQAGANDYVTKPVDFAVVCARIYAQLVIRDTYKAALADRSKQIRNAEDARAELEDMRQEFERLRAAG